MAEAQAQTFKHELLLFKKSAAASTKVTNQLWDDDIRKKFDNVFYALQDFALSPLHQSSMDFSRLSDTAKAWSSSYICDPSDMSRDYTPQVMLSLFSQILICLFEPEHFFGVPQGALGTAAKELAARMRTADTPNNKAWLDLTRKVLIEIDHKAILDADQMLAEMAVKHTVEMLSAAIAINWEAEKPTLHKVFSSVIGLYRDLHCCKAIFKLRMIGCRSFQDHSVFETTTIEAVACNENEDSLASRPIEFSVFPGIYKYGNETCQNQHQMTVISRARVVPRKIKRKPARLEEGVSIKNVRIKQEPV